jgi:MFS family permease
VGGRLAERFSYRPPILTGLAAALAGFALMGWSWDADIAYGTMAWQLALLGVGFGLVIAPTAAAVVDAATPDRRGTAAGLVMVLRLIGLSVGLAGLTAWGLHRYGQLRGTIELPPITDPTYADLLARAQAELTTTALAETFMAATVVAGGALLVGLVVQRRKDSPFLRELLPHSGNPPRKNEGKAP